MLRVVVVVVGATVALRPRAKLQVLDLSIITVIPPFGERSRKTAALTQRGRGAKLKWYLELCQSTNPKQARNLYVELFTALGLVQREPLLPSWSNVYVLRSNVSPVLRRATVLIEGMVIKKKTV